MLRKELMTENVWNILETLYWKAFKDGKKNDGFCDQLKDCRKARADIYKLLKKKVSQECNPIHVKDVLSMLKEVFNV